MILGGAKVMRVEPWYMRLVPYKRNSRELHFPYYHVGDGCLWTSKCALPGMESAGTLIWDVPGSRTVINIFLFISCLIWYFVIEVWLNGLCLQNWIPAPPLLPPGSVTWGKDVTSVSSTTEVVLVMFHDLGSSCDGSIRSHWSRTECSTKHLLPGVLSCGGRNEQSWDSHLLCGGLLLREAQD